MEGVTNLGWLLLIAPLAMVLDVPIAAKLSSLALIGATIMLILAVSRNIVRHSEDHDALARLPLLVIVTLATNDEYVTFSLLGMETAALSTVLAVMLLLTTSGHASRGLPMLGLAAFLIRPEAALVYPLFAMISIFGRLARRRDMAVGMLIFVTGIAVITAARWWYFGDVVPNTFISKSSNLWRIAGNLVGWIDGSSVNIAFPFAGILALLALSVGTVKLWQASRLPAAMALSITLSGLLFALYALPDWTKLGRYFRALCSSRPDHLLARCRDPRASATQTPNAARNITAMCITIAAAIAVAGIVTRFCVRQAGFGRPCQAIS